MDDYVREHYPHLYKVMEELWHTNSTCHAHFDAFRYGWCGIVIGLPPAVVQRLEDQANTLSDEQITELVGGQLASATYGVAELDKFCGHIFDGEPGWLAEWVN